MIAPRLYARKDWERVLRNYGCKPVAAGEARKLQTAEWWVTPKKKLFTVPIEGDDDRCGKWELDEILRQLPLLK